MASSGPSRRELLSASALAGSTVILDSFSAGAKTISGQVRRPTRRTILYRLRPVLINFSTRERQRGLTPQFRG